MFCTRADLLTESDVEQKLVLPLLTTAAPHGFGYSAADLRTKLNIRRLEIGKGQSRKLYFPDYLVLLSGLPVMVVEVKAPGEDVHSALGEARLYAAEINALFSSGFNPCSVVLASNADVIVMGAWDASSPLIEVKFEDISVASVTFASMVSAVQRATLAPAAARLRQRGQSSDRIRPTTLLGGQSVRNEQLGHNSFGAALTLEYGHIFNPVTPNERAYVVQHAYIPSLRRDRYVEPIDRLIRGVVTPALRGIDAFENTAKPKEITAVFDEHVKKLESKLVLLVGSVGSGKSTFIDYLTQVALPRDVLERTVWLRVNLNNAPPAKEVALSWLTEQVITGLRESAPEVDFDELSTIRRVYAPELKAFTKGALALLPEGSEDYRKRLFEKIVELQADRTKTAKCMSRYLCGNAAKLLVVCLDNCDKRDREEQLLMFQLSQWLQVELRCLVFLPLRDVTYDAHRNEPPLDTAIKNLTFRIEPPRFSDVLAKRVQLALADLVSRAKEKTIEYTLPNGMRVEYPASDQGMYLSSIVRSLYAHDRFVRRIMSGLAGRDIRKALEIFMEFCTSGHIGEDQIYQIRAMDGQHTIPFEIVARVLLRMNRRFYDGDRSYVKNLFQCDPADIVPDHFVRISILRWLEQRLKEPGATGLSGFHRAGELVADLVQLGHEAERVRRELRYLLKERCVVAEHQRTDELSDVDQISLSPSGSVHLSLAVVPDYLAACIEDTWLAERPLAQVVADRIGRGGARQHYERRTIRQNARSMVEYLEYQLGLFSRDLVSTSALLSVADYVRLGDIKSGMSAPQTVHSRVFVGNLPFDTDAAGVERFFVSHGFAVGDVVLVVDKKSGRFSGACLVSLASPADATRAVDGLDGELVGGRRVRLEFAEVPVAQRRSTQVPVAGRVDPCRLALFNLPYDASVESVNGLIVSKGLRHTDVHLSRDGSGQAKGFAFVEFQDEDETRRAIGLLNGELIGGRKIRAAPAFEKAARREVRRS